MSRVEELTARIPLGVLGDATEVADAVMWVSIVFLCCFNDTLRTRIARKVNS